ncbi:MAG TPA: serine/threonine-protein kinase [Solirubrobacterales bacterium]|nr:serine/threonine-protein kinase [Solirubrobacterales bacterium]
MTELSIGSEFAGHRIDSVAGRGGMGVLYKATHLELDVTRALKVIVPEHTQDEEFRARFKREWRLAARIEHPNVIPVHEVGEEDGVLYISMRFVEGQDFGRLISSEGPLEPGRAANIIDQVGYALDAAHEAGLVHRDVKPANVLIEPSQRGERAYLTDFGLTKAAASKTAMTASGMFVGTIDYMSPEQFEGDTLDARADVYSLGCVLYQSLTGQIPFDREGYQARIFAHMTAEAPVPSAVVPSLPTEFDEIVRRAMAKDPDERFLSAGDLGRATLAAASGQHVSRAQRNVARGEAAPKSAAPTPAVPPPKVEEEPEPEAARPDSSGAEPAPDEIAAGAADETALATPTPPGRERPPEPPDAARPAGRSRRTPLLIAGGVIAVIAIVVVAVMALGGGGSQTDRVQSALSATLSDRVGHDVSFSCSAGASGGYDCEDDATGAGQVRVISQGGDQYSFSGIPGQHFSGMSGEFTAD